MKSAGVHLVKFLFILPIVAVLLIAFRGKQDADTIPPGKDVFPVKETDRSVIDLKTAIFTDTVRPQRVANSKGYLIDIKGVNGNCVVVVNNKEGKEVERILLTEWNNDQEKYEAKYGEILPPPPPPPGSPVAVEGVPMVAPVPPVPPVEVIGVPVTPLPCEEITAPLAALVTDNNFSRIGKEWEITKTRAWIKLKDGKEEVYDFTKPAEKAKFEKKYGRIIEVEELDELKAPVAVIGRPGSGGVTAYAPSPTGDEVVEVVGYTPKAGVIAGKDISHLITGNEDIIVTITKTSTRAQLDDFVGQMKAKGVELKFEDVEYEGNTLVRLTGTMKMNENQSNFVAVDFERLILAMIKKDGKTYFKVSTQDDKRVI